MIVKLAIMPITISVLVNQYAFVVVTTVGHTVATVDYLRNTNIERATISQLKKVTVAQLSIA
jgi:hypothetical protein